MTCVAPARKNVSAFSAHIPPPTCQQQDGGNFKKEFLEKESEPLDEVRIIRTKRFDMKPMYPEDACIQMELLGHNFFVFCNAENEEVNVVYKRKGNTYGLIEPEE